MGDPLPARLAEARARLQDVVRGHGDRPWSDADIIRLDALCTLGRPGESVTNLPPVVTAKGDNRGGRMGSPTERCAASVLQSWREVGALCGHPLPAPHAMSAKKETK